GFQNVSLMHTISLSELIIDVNKENIPKSFNWFLWTKVFFGIGTAFFLFLFVRELVKIKRLYQQSEKEIYDELIVCKISKPHQVFSFWKTVFIDRNLFETIIKNETIWIHEKRISFKDIPLMFCWWNCVRSFSGFTRWFICMNAISK